MRLQRLFWGLMGLQLFVFGAAEAANPENGQLLAERWCAGCHTISRNHKPVTTTEAPPFSAVAHKPDFNASAVALFLLSPHPRMPDMGLSRNDAADLAAFIALQR